MSATLLIVDDSTSMRQMVAFALTGGGYTVVEAARQLALAASLGVDSAPGDTA